MTTDDLLSGLPGGGESDRAMPSMGTLVIRTWNEPDQAQGFRARLTYSVSPTAEPEAVYTVDPDEVLRLVRQWLHSQSKAP
ncbi:hypothetical protein [Arthrobacter sp. Z4-13]|jgi:hypothetical protein